MDNSNTPIGPIRHGITDERLRQFVHGELNLNETLRMNVLIYDDRTLQVRVKQIIAAIEDDAKKAECTEMLEELSDIELNRRSTWSELYPGVKEPPAPSR